MSVDAIPFGRYSILMSIFDGLSLGLLNMRGSDIDFNPVFFAYVIVTPTEAHFVVDASKLPENFQRHFDDNQATLVVSPYEGVTTLLKNLVRIYGRTFNEL